MFKRLRAKIQNSPNGWRWSGATVEGVPLPDWPIDLWQIEWTPTGERAQLTDPRHFETRSLPIYEASADSCRVMFAASEFSNGIFGFYLKA